MSKKLLFANMQSRILSVTYHYYCNSNETSSSNILKGTFYIHDDFILYPLNFKPIFCLICYYLHAVIVLRGFNSNTNWCIVFVSLFVF